MAYENLQLNTNNFCASARNNDEFGNIDHSNGTFRIRTSSATTMLTCALSTAVSEIQSIEYVGPRNVGGTLNQLGTKLPFFTLEKNSSSQCTVREWRLDAPSSVLRLHNTIVMDSVPGSYSFDCYDMSVEYYHTSLSSATTTGTGFIQLDDDSNIEVGDELLIGPSGDVDNLYAYEWVTVSSISGSNVYITASGTVPAYEYVAGDKVSFYKHIYLFSDIGEDGDITKGSLYKLTTSGTVEEAVYSGEYSGVRASAWSTDYSSIGMVKGNNLLYIDPNNSYQIQRSHTLTNVNADEVTVLPVYDLVFNANSVYRLQDKITLVNDNGDKSTSTWATYNYHQDVINPYTKNILIYPEVDGIFLNDESNKLYAIVRDEYGVGLLNKLVTFSKISGDTSGYFTPLNGQVLTNSDGVAEVLYHTGYYDPVGVGNDTESIVINARTDGASTYTGSQYVNERIEFLFCKKFTINLFNIIQKPTWSGGVPTDGDLYSQMYLNQMSNSYTQNSYLKSLSKFQFPGGDWIGAVAPISQLTSVTQILSFVINEYLSQIASTESSSGYLKQDKQRSDVTQISQLYISKHSSTGHKDTADIDQFRFIEDAVPAFWSEKNPINTNIWIRLRPFAFSLSQSTLVFKVRDTWFAGDTGYIDVTNECTITTFDAGGGLLGLDILYNPSDFHYSSVVYVSIEVYDMAPTPNIILTDYWFRIIPDYKSPYFDNESPTRASEEVSITTDISFDVHDAGVGVDISTLELYVNNRIKTPTSITPIYDGYHVVFNPSENFYYGESVEVSVKVRDSSEFRNVVYDMWRFYCEGSTGPWIDPSSFYPRNCVRGTYRKTTGISFNVYGVDDTGVDPNSILVTVGGKRRDVSIIPIVYRLD